MAGWSMSSLLLTVQNVQPIPAMVATPMVANRMAGIPGTEKPAAAKQEAKDLAARMTKAAPVLKEIPMT